MAYISPFKAIRATKEYVERFVASAFDSDIQEEVFNRQKENQYSYLHILNPQIFSEQVLSEKDNYELSKSKFQDLISSGILKEDAEPALYLYRQVKHNATFTAVIGLASLKEYRNNTIRKHEHTRTEKEEGIIQYFKTVGINANPVLLTYPENPKLSLVLHELTEPAPDYHFFTEDDTEHYLWTVRDSNKLKEIEDLFSQIPALYIADGHHRCAALNELEDIKGFMACFIADSEVRIHSFNRYISDLNGMSKAEFLGKLRERFMLERNEFQRPDPMPGKVDFYLDNEWYSLRIPEKMKAHRNPKENLDVFIIDRYIFIEILGVKDIRTSDRVMFVNGDVTKDFLLRPIEAGKMAAVFSLNPVNIKEVIEVSDYGEIMPPKSTWIEPKLHSGLLIHKIL